MCPPAYSTVPTLNVQMLHLLTSFFCFTEGCRRWSWLVEFFEAHLERSMKFFFGSFRVIRDFDADAAPSRCVWGPRSGSVWHICDGWVTSSSTPRATGVTSYLADHLLLHPEPLPWASFSQPGTTHPEPFSDPFRQYIFSFHPHGHYPTGAGLLPLSSSFRDAFPGIKPVTLVSGS